MVHPPTSDAVIAASPPTRVGVAFTPFEDRPDVVTRVAVHAESVGMAALGYGRELDAVLDANSDPRNPTLPSAAARLADDVLVFGTYDDAPALCRRWHEHADALALVVPFGTAVDDLVSMVDAVAPVGAPR